MAEAQTTTGIDAALIEEIVGRVLSVAGPDRIILFGSAATGEMARDSDTDLLVVEPHERDRRRGAWRSVTHCAAWATPKLRVLSRSCAEPHVPCWP